MVEERVFNGRVFRLYQRTHRKGDAQVIAQRLRDEGYYVRITYEYGWWMIWYSSKSFFDRFF